MQRGPVVIEDRNTIVLFWWNMACWILYTTAAVAAPPVEEDPRRPRQTPVDFSIHSPQFGQFRSVN